MLASNEPYIILLVKFFHFNFFRWQLYVGNLTWWTTDQDIQDGVVNLGVSDFIEVSKNTVLTRTSELK